MYGSYIAIVVAIIWRFGGVTDVPFNFWIALGMWFWGFLVDLHTIYIRNRGKRVKLFS